MDRPIIKLIALCLAATCSLATPSALKAGGDSQDMARRALCEAQMAVCESEFDRSNVCNAGYRHCIAKGTFPMPATPPHQHPDSAMEIVIEPAIEDKCEKQMRECRDPDWEPSATYSDGSPVLGPKIQN